MVKLSHQTDILWTWCSLICLDKLFAGSPWTVTNTTKEDYLQRLEDAA